MAYELKTKKNESSVDEFLAGVEPEDRREDCIAIRGLMRELTGDDGAMWGPSIVGFGKYSYKYASGHSGEWFVTGFAPRKRDLTLYIMSGFDRYDELLTKLGKHSTGKSCLYVKRLSEIDMDVLRELVAESIKVMQANETGE